jgi:periplasmic protein TonB
MAQPEPDDDEKSFLQKYGWILGLFAVLLVGGGIYLLAGKKSGGSGKAKARPPEMQMVKLMPPPPPPPKLPPPPPPPPSLTPPPKEEMVEQTPVEEPEAKPEEAAPEAPPTDSLTVDAAGTGPGDSFGLVGRPGGGGGTGGGGRIGGGKRGSKFGWYAGQVQQTVQQALLSNEKTRMADLRVEIRIWADSNGRVTRATISGSTGDPALDAAITQDVLTGLKLKEPPPADMPMPIVMRITAKRPG